MVAGMISKYYSKLPSSMSGGSPPTKTFLENRSVEFGSKCDAPGAPKAASCWFRGEDLAAAAAK